MSFILIACGVASAWMGFLFFVLPGLDRQQELERSSRVRRSAAAARTRQQGVAA